MPIVDMRNTPTVIEVGPGATVAEFTEEQVTAEVMVGPTVVEFSWGELIPGPGLKGGGPFEGTVYIDQDIPGLPPGIEPIDPINDLVMVYDMSREEHVKRPVSDLGGGGGVEFATVPEAEAAIVDDKAIAPDVAGIVYDRLHHWGTHTAGKGTQSFNLVDDYSITLNAQASNVFRVTLQGNRTLILPVNPVPGQVIKLRFKQDSVGGRTMTWPVGIRWIMGITPVMTTAPHAVDVVFLAYDEVDEVWEGSFLPDYTGTGTGWGILPAGPQGIPGTPGLVGPTGPAGPPGITPTGGVTGDVLTKLSAVDGDYDWVSLGSFTFAGLGDVNVASVVNGDSIVWDSTTSKWIPAIFGMAGLVDVSLAGLVDNQVLFYNSTGGLWTPETLTAAHITDFSEAVDDRVAALFVPGNNIDVTYNDASGTFTIDVEGLTSVDISDFSEAVDDRVSTLLVAGSNMSLTYNDAAGTLTLASTATGVPPGGTTGQALVKNSATDGDASWATISGGGGGANIFMGSEFKYQANDLVITSNAIFQDTNLTVDLIPGTYAVELFVEAGVNATPDMQFELSYSGTVEKASGLRVFDVGGVDEVQVWSAMPMNVNMTSTGTYYNTISATIKVTTAGTLKVQAKQVTSSATSVTFAAGSRMTVSRLDGAALAESGCVLTRAALQTFTTTASAVIWDTEVRDNGNYWTSSPNPTRIVIPQSGWYTLIGTAEQAGDADDVQRMWFTKNGAAMATATHKSRLGNASIAIAVESQVVESDYYTAGDYLELMVQNRSGSSTCYARVSVIQHSGMSGLKGPPGESTLVSGSNVAYAVKRADTSRASTTVLADDPEMALRLEPNTIYEFDAYLAYYYPTASGIKWSPNFTGTTTSIKWTSEQGTNGGAAFGTIHTAYYSGTYDVEPGASCPGWSSGFGSLIGYARVKGTIEVGGAGGTFSMQWAQNTSSATAALVYKNSFLKITKVSPGSAIGTVTAGTSFTHVDAPPASPDIINDEFEGTTLDPKWTWLRQGAGSVAVKHGVATITGEIPGAGNPIVCLKQPAPDGTFKYRAKLAMTALSSSSSFFAVGFGVYNSANNRITQIEFMRITTSPRRCLVTQYSADGATRGTELIQFDYAGVPVIGNLASVWDWSYVEIESNGTNLFFRASLTGHDGTFHLLSSPTIASYMAGVTHLTISCMGTAGTAAPVPLAHFDWVRRIGASYEPGKLMVNSNQSDPRYFTTLYETDCLPFSPGWSVFTQNGSSVSSTNIADPEHPGVFQCASNSNSASSGSAVWSLTDSVFTNFRGCPIPANDDLVLEGIMRVNVVVPTHAGGWEFGLLNFGDGLNYVSVRGGFNNTLCIRCKALGVTTDTVITSPIPANATWFRVRLEMRSSAVKAYINGVLAATATANIPGTGIALTPGFIATNSVVNIGAVPVVLDVDYLRWSRSFSTARSG